MNATKFLELVRLSGLVEEDELARVLSELVAAGTPLDDGKQVADRLLQEGLLTLWQADKLLEGKHKGFFLGKYKLLGHLGYGRMSSVYLAEHTLWPRRVAVKVLPMSGSLPRFYREARALAGLSHPNIVLAHDIDEDNGYHYLVMEYIPGRTLANILADLGPASIPDAVDWMMQAATGLEYIHALGIIHCNVEPSNLMLTDYGQVKVIDSGWPVLLKNLPARRR